MTVSVLINLTIIDKIIPHQCFPLLFLICTPFTNVTLFKLALPSYFPYSNNKKNYHFDLTGAFSNIIEESEAIEYDDDDDEDEFDDDDDD